MAKGCGSGAWIRLMAVDARTLTSLKQINGQTRALDSPGAAAVI